MEQNDREYRDMLNEGLKKVEPSDELHAKVRGSIARNVAHVRRRNAALRTVAVAIVLTMALSSVTPVFGRNGTLPQVITAMAAERQAQKMNKKLGTATVQQTSAALQASAATVQAVNDSALSETDSILALVISERSGKSIDEVLALRKQGLGWGIIMAQLDVSGHDVGKAMSEAQEVAVAGTQEQQQEQARGKVTLVTATLLHIDGYAHDLVLATGTKVEQVGAGNMTVAAIKIGQMVQVHVSLTGTTYTATQVHIEDKYVKTDTAKNTDSANDTQGEQQKTSNGQQARGKVTLVTATLLHIDGYAHDIVLATGTKVEQVGAGNMTVAAIKIGQMVQVHVSLTGTTYTATQVHIEDKYVKTDKTTDEDQQTDPSVKTWQGTIASVVPQTGNNPINESMIGTVALTAESGQPTFYWVLPTSVLQDASHHTLTLAALQALPNLTTQKVTIQGRLLADGSVDIVKLMVTTTGTTTNPGKGKGNDKSGNN
jgi:uncharacterized protein YqgC (DUF456 family)